MQPSDPPIRATIRDLEASKIGVIADYGRYRPGIIPLWFGESDLPTPDFICQAASRAMAAGQTKYAPRRGIPPLREAIAGYMTGLYGVPVGVDRISVTASGMSAIMIAMQALVEPGRSVVMVTPVWPNAAATVRTMGGVVREVALGRRPDGEMALDLDELFAAIDATTVAIFVNSPNNPTGWMMSEAEARAILAEARRRGVWIFSDEVYARIAYDRPAAPSFIEIAEPDDRVIVVNSFSKTWAMTGWRLGWLTIPPSLGPFLEKLGEFNTSGAATFVQAAGITAIHDGEPFLEMQRTMFAANRDLIHRRLGQLPHVRIARPKAAFYAFFSVEGETDSLAFAHRIVDEANVGLAPGAAFGKGGEGNLRLCFAAATRTVETALDRLLPLLTC